MTRFLTSAAVTALVAPAAAAADATSVSVAYFAPGSPALVRFDVTLDGKPIEPTWAAAVDGLFAHLDRNGDGGLDETERAPLGARPRSGRRPALDVGDVTASDFVGRLTFDKAVTKVDRAAFADALKAAGLGPVAVQFQAPADNSPALTTALFRHLDADGDGKLSKAELAAARERLELLDVNEDEWLTAAELLTRGTANPRAAFAPRVRTPDPTPVNPNDLLVLAGPPVKAVKQLLAARGKSKATTLSRAEMGMTETEFAKFDRDGNGSLDTDELSGWLTQPPALTMTVALQADAAKSVVTPLGVTTAVHSRFEVAPPAGTSANEWAVTASQLRAAFTAAAKDGVVAKDQLTTQPALAAAFAMIDRNGDEKIDDKELTAALAAFAPLAVCRADVTVVDQGRGLFELIDTNADGQLSQRELAAVPTVLKDYLAADGSLTRTQVPRSFPVRPVANGIRPLGMGAPTRDLVAFADGQAMTAPRRSAPPSSAPAWFAKMDRNADGDVSRKEFLGPLDLFRKLDADGDGLISADEAKAAKE